MSDLTAVSSSSNASGESALFALRETVARLRAPGGCPWDREQTHQSICDCLIEEVAELLETIDRLDMPHMREELGDLLLHVVMHAQMAEEAGHFDLEAVAAEVNEKLIRRHPHVFGDLDLKDSEAVLQNWDQIKATEKKNGVQGAGLFKHLPPQLSALLSAREVFKQITKKHLPAPPSVDQARIESLSKQLTEPEAGQRLFELAAACRLAGIDPESALRRFTQTVQDQTEARAAKS
ncbi:MazG family protein [Ruficoccus amylovorans]|uniref:MazG family protein n=1 Tax=Ruficoccus amylovorans TaxID=1804625 RepID=A0A842HIB1_9BACT|nr:MazG family protein [Ruficoccus amylovorans]MBC2595304.1 MazG family protein [Ruficoccus amylovorans]